MKNKNRAVELTMSLPGIPPRRGRPPTGNAMSAAQRQKIYRKNQLSDARSNFVWAAISSLSAQFSIPKNQIVAELLAFALENHNWRKTGFSVTRDGKGKE